MARKRRSQCVGQGPLQESQIGGKRRVWLSYLRQFFEHLKRRIRPKPEPEDLYAYRMAPVKRPPGGRSGAAVAELDKE